MKPTSFKETNIVFEAGGNPNTGDLPVCVAAAPGYPAGIAFIVSKWKLTPEELEQISKTGEVWMSVMTQASQITTPPIMPMIFDPFENDGFKPMQIIKPGADQ